jgi:glyoxylate reductase
MDAIPQRYRVLADSTDRPATANELAHGFSQADAVICTLADRIDASVLSQATKLKIVANYAVGYNNIDLSAATQHGIVVTNTPDVLTHATADLTWALLLAVARREPSGENANATTEQVRPSSLASGIAVRGCMGRPGQA